MRIEDLRASRRPEAEWEPFMHQLSARMARRRRARVLNWAAAAALVLAALGGLLLMPAPKAPEPSLRAHVPTLSDPVFTPSSGAAVSVSGGAVVILPEART
jgi:hypothetical protein